MHEIGKLPVEASRHRCGRSDLAWALVFGALFAAAIVSIKPFAPPLGWAAFDAREYHFAVINYFVTHGFDFGYPPELAMFPGMHAVFAAAARVLGLGPLAFDGRPAFLIQSVTAALFIAATLRLWLVTSSDKPGSAVLLLPLFCSSYPVYSWLWPTTDLGADACFVGMLLLALRSGWPNWRTATAFAAMIVVATLFRQIYAPLGAGLLGVALLRLLTGEVSADPIFSKPDGHSRFRRIGCLGGRTGFHFGLTALRARARDLGPALLPLLAGGAVLLGLYALWGGLLPPELRRHESSGMQLVTIAHAIALTGLVAWPFALPVGRRLGGREATAVALLAAIVAAIVCLVVPLDPDPAAGRGGSLVWTIAAALRSPSLGLAFTGAIMAIGLGVWIGCLRLAWRERDAAPELVLFGLFLATFLVQSMAWQRYVEFQILAVLTVFVGRRAPPRGVDALLFGGWFAVYTALTVAKPFLGFAGKA